MMDAKRAQEIVDAAEEIAVQCEGQSVWIDKVDKISGSASIHMKEDPSIQKIVPVEQLKENVH
ncbi:H-type small acid-soluble spore protein [Marinicrinis sediminis]|uniref:H-type small acid-soluble spore protein n=1 Tax=Marinicrinis sediminis TaxID=1652465 RepID=A0ABW5R8T0_9BACL